MALVIPSQVVNSQSTAEETSIQNANAAINQAFNSVLEAERSGGNVTQLLTRLNSAAEILADAQNSYQTGNTTGVSSKAVYAKRVADLVNTDAIALKDASSTLTSNSFWFIFTFSMGGAIVFGFLMLIVWQRFRRAYIKKMKSMKPDVVYRDAT